MSFGNHDNCGELTNSTEAFSSDHPNSIPFILWIKYKSNGSMKLKHISCDFTWFYPLNTFNTVEEVYNVNSPFDLRERESHCNLSTNDLEYRNLSNFLLS